MTVPKTVSREQAINMVAAALEDPADGVELGDLGAGTESREITARQLADFLRRSFAHKYVVVSVMLRWPGLRFVEAAFAFAERVFDVADFSGEVARKFLKCGRIAADKSEPWGAEDQTGIWVNLFDAACDARARAKTNYGGSGECDLWAKLCARHACASAVNAFRRKCIYEAVDAADYAAQALSFVSDEDGAAMAEINWQLDHLVQLIEGASREEDVKPEKKTSNSTLFSLAQNVRALASIAENAHAAYLAEPEMGVLRGNEYTRSLRNLEASKDKLYKFICDERSDLEDPCPKRRGNDD